MINNNAPLISNWPPICTIRRSRRAARIFLQITPEKGLEVVIPEKRKQFNIEKILDEKRTWIEKMLLRYEIQLLKEKNPLTLPEMIEFPAIHESWRILYQQNDFMKRINIIQPPPTNEIPVSEKLLMLKGNTADRSLCHKTLKKWLTQKARLALLPWLKNLSFETGLLYTYADIRSQRTLWGSCNARKIIHLNYKLLFLPEMLAKHILLHELCHLKYLNHSKKFWEALKSLDPDFMDHKRALKTAERYVPPWTAGV